MRKIYSLIAMFIMAIAANAQVISFSEAADKGTLDGKTFENGGLVLTVTDTDGKCAVDANSQYFGTAEEYVNYGYRFKTGGKSSSKNALTLTVPSDGTLKISARSASSSEARPIVLTENGTELLNQNLDDANAVKATIGEAEKNVFPVYSCSVTAGTVEITYPTNGVNIYAIELVAAKSETPVYTATITSDPEDIYYSGYFDFDMNQVASDLGLADKGALYDFVNAGGNVYIKQADGTLSNAYTGNTNEFWMDTTGAAVSYGETAAWYAGIYYDPAGSDDEGNTWDEEFYTKVGQMPGYFKTIYEPSTLTTTLVLVNGDKQVEFNITLNVNAAVKPADIPDPVNYLSKLNVVKEYDMTVSYTEGKQYENITTSVDVSDMYNALGVDEASLASNIEKILLTQSVNSEASTVLVDSLASFSNSFGTDGWFGRYTAYDETTGAESQLDQNGPMSWGSGCTFYLHEPTLADGQFTITSGQYPGTMAAGSTDYAVVYLVYGDKAAKVTIHMDIKAVEKIPFDQMVKVGEQEITADPLEVANAYTSVLASFDAAAITTALGCTADDLVEYNFGDENLNSIVDPTTNDYWLSEQGYTQAWSSSPCCQLTMDMASGTATLLQMAGKYYEITEAATYPMYYIYAYGSNYYVLKFNFTLKPVSSIEGELTCVATEEIHKQIIPADSYDVDGTTDLDLEYVNSLIGTKSPTVYGDKYNSETGKLEMDKNYSCYDTENKGFGFWYGLTTYENEEGQVVVDNAGWSGSGENSFGFQYFTDGHIQYFQYPSIATAGQEYVANLYLVNEATGDYVKYVITTSYVDSIMPEAETVGTEEIAYQTGKNIDYNDDGVLVATLDMTQCFEALGIVAEDLEACEIIGQKSKTTFSTYEAEEDIMYTANGYATSAEANIAYTANGKFEDGKFVVTVDPMDALPEGSENVIDVRIGILYNNSRYIFKLAFGETDAVAISSVAANAANANAIYTVAGAKVNGLQKGVNIVKMADGSVKKIMK